MDDKTKNKIAGTIITGALISGGMGFLIAIFNPKIFVFLTAIFSQFIAAGMPLSDRLIITCLALVIDTSWYIIVASALSGTPLLEALKQRARLIDIVVAIILLGLAITIFAKYLM